MNSGVKLAFYLVPKSLRIGHLAYLDLRIREESAGDYGVKDIQN